MSNSDQIAPATAISGAGPRRFAVGVFIANSAFLGVGAVILLFFGQRLFGTMLGLPAATGFLWQLLGICALGLAVLSGLAARARNGDTVFATLVTLLIFQVGSALVSFITGSTTDHAVFANFVPHLILGVLLGIAWWRLHGRWI